MRKLSKLRIRRILEKHCMMVKAEFFRPVTDEYGDVTGTEKYAEYDMYFSQLLHRYNPYVGLNTDDDNTVYKRYTPMAVVPYDEPINISDRDTVRIDSKDYTVSFVEDIKGYYYLLSLIPRE